MVTSSNCILLSFHCFPRQLPTCKSRYYRDDFHGHLALSAVVGMPHCTVVCLCVEEPFRHFQQVDILVVHLVQGGFVEVIDRGRDGAAVDTENGYLAVMSAQLLQYLCVRSHELAFERFRFYGEVVGTQVDDDYVGSVCLEVPLFLGTFIESLQHLVTHGHSGYAYGIAIVTHSSTTGVSH